MIFRENKKNQTKLTKIVSPLKEQIDTIKIIFKKKHITHFHLIINLRILKMKFGLPTLFLILIQIYKST